MDDLQTVAKKKASDVQHALRWVTEALDDSNVFANLMSQVSVSVGLPEVGYQTWLPAFVMVSYDFHIKHIFRSI